MVSATNLATEKNLWLLFSFWLPLESFGLQEGRTGLATLTITTVLAELSGNIKGERCGIVEKSL